MAALLLAGGGTTRTIAYLGGASHEQQEKVLGHLQKLPQVTAGDITKLLTDRRHHYAGILGELGTTYVD